MNDRFNEEECEKAFEAWIKTQYREDYRPSPNKNWVIESCRVAFRAAYQLQQKRIDELTPTKKDV